MKTSRMKRVRALGIVFALIIALTMITLTACNDGVAVESISVVESSVSGYYAVSGFDITTVQLQVTYVDGTTNVISAEKSMLTTEGKTSLTTPGEKNVTINYKGKTAILNVTLVEDDASIVCVTFKDSVGNQLVQKYALVGGSVVAPDAPVVEGQTFVAWVDADGKKVDLNNVSESITVTASYSVTKTAYTVKFFDYNGKELSSAKVNAGEKVVAKNAPSVSLSKYPEIESYEWSVSFPYTVDTDTVIWMVPTYKSFSVQFAYALEDNVSDQKVISTLGKVVKYEEDVKSSLNAAKKAITDLGYEIVTSPSNSTTITKDTTFLFIVRNASVSVTVYGDPNKESVKQQASLNPGTTLNLPSTAAAVTDKRHVGWTIEGSDLFLEIGDAWTVNSDYGREVVFVPVYEKDTIKVNFRFEFAEIVLTTDATQKYAVTLSVTEEFALHDAVTYEFIDSLLINLIDNASDYQALLGGSNVNNDSVNKTATDNSSIERESAFNSVKNNGIASVSATVSGATKFVTVSESVNLNADDLTFTVTLTGATKGLVFTKVEETVEEQTITYYELTALNSDYVAGTNVYIPDNYKQSGDTESYPVTKISTTDLAGKTIIHVSANLTEIADGAFEGSILYGNLDFGKVTTIGANAFGGANVGSDVKFDVLTSLGAGAFSGIKGQDVSIDLGKVITAISANAFANAEGIKEVVIPNTVVEIGNSAFENAEVGGIATLESVTTLGENALKGAILAEINLPVITSLGAGALSDMDNLVNVNLGANGKAEDNVTIDVSAFEGSVGIETLTVGVGIVNITDASNILATFEKLNAINVLEGNAKLYSEDGVLYAVVDNAASLVYYPNNKTGNYTASKVEGYTYSVNASAFDNAVVAVLDLSSVGIATYNGVTSGSVFAVVVSSEGEVASAQSAFSASSIFVAGASVGFGYDETNQLIYKTEVRTINEEETTVAIVVGGYKYATSIVVPTTLGGHSVVAIASGAFANYEDLTSLKVEAVVESWDSMILAGCSALTELEIAGFVKDENGAVDVEMSDFVGNAWFNAHNIIYIGGTLLGYNNNAIDAHGNAITVVSKEDTANYFEDKIPENFFFVDDGSGNNVCNVTEIAFADDISEIERSAFEGCAQLKKVDFNKVSTIRRYAFASCVSLEEVVYDGVIMEEGAFSECDNLVSATLTNKLNANKGRYYLPVMAFNGCDSLEKVDFTYVNAFSSDESGSSYAFYGCSSLTEYDFSKIVMESIPGKTFGMTGLKYVDFTVMPSVTTVGQMAFENATSLKYVKFGATVKSILDSAFFGVTNLVVEVPYDAPGGLYEDINLVSSTAFDDSALFFISSTVDVTGTFLEGKNVDSSYPTVDFAFSESMADKGETLGMVAINNKVFFTEADFVNTVLNGYQFVGWYAEESETTRLAFPLVFTDDVTVYAKYYSDKQGSLDSTTDVKYVYYLAGAPEVDLALDEIVKWYVTENGVETLIESWPLIIDAQSDVEYGIVGKIQKSIGGVMTVTDVVECGDIGTQGYAIVNYSDNNANNVSIPDYYDDEVNGSKEIIVVFSGAFSNETLLMKEFTLPAYTRAIVMGSGSASDDFSEYTKDTTFNSNLETITIPSSVEYIADGVFAGLSNLSDIVFEENSNLVKASVKSFYGSAWYLNALAKARAETNGFIVAGRLAIEFVGTGTVVIVDESEKQVTEDYGFVENTDGINVMYTVYFKDGTVEAGLLENQIATEVTNGVFKYDFVVGGMDVTLALNTVDSTNWSYANNKNLFVFDVAGAAKEVLAISFKSVEDGEVTVPSDVIKLGNGIFKNNQELVTIIINSNLTEVGDEVFFNSTLSSVKFGATNSEQYSSKVSVIGKDAFNGTPWYRGENVILGTIYLKYNNVSGNTTLTITESITAIASGAFKDAKLLSTVNIAGIKTLAKIGAYAFSGSGITAIELPAGVQEIGRGAFENCVSLLSVNMSKAQISALPQDTFKGNVALNAIELADSVVSLGKNSLSGCAALTSIVANGISELKVIEGSGEVEFESGLQNTGWYNTVQQKDDVMLILGSVVVRFILGSETVVDQTTNVLSVSIPEGIVTVAQGAFKSVDTVTEINIPDSVTYIGKYAFEDCKDLNTVNFGGNVETIDAYAFSGCTALKNVKLSDAMVTIGDGAFKNTAITTAVLNEQGVKVEDNGFTIPASVTSIGKEAFEGVNTLTVINIGSKVVNIGDKAFYTSGTLYKVNWELDINSTVGENDEEIPAPITVLYENTKNYGTTIFAAANGIGNVRFYTTEDNYKFVNSDEFIGKNAWANFGWEFFANGNYPLVEFDKNGYNLSTISSEYILEGDIPTPVHDTMGDGKTYTFMYWYVNKENEPIAYPYSVYGDVTFNARWYENELNENAGEIIGNDGAKHSIEASDGKAIINAIDNAPATLYIPNTINGNLIVGLTLSNVCEEVTTLVLTNASNFNGLSENIFSVFPNLEKVELQSSDNVSVDFKVVNTPITATYNEKEYTYNFKAIYTADDAKSEYGKNLIAFVGNVDKASKELLGEDSETVLDFVFNVPQGVENIYANALANSALRTVSIPNSVKVIGDNAFGKELTTLRVAKNVYITDVTYNAIDANAPIMQNNAESTTYSDYTEIKGFKTGYVISGSTYGYFYVIANALVGYDTSVNVYGMLELPTTVNGIDVTVIASEINVNGAEITADELGLPTNVRRINGNAFKGIDVLSSIKYDGQNLTDIANDVFGETTYYQGSNDGSLILGKVLVKWQCATNEVAVPEGIVTISYDAFNSSQATSVKLPSTLTTISDRAFYGADKLTTISIPNSVTTIGNDAFHNCDSLTTVTFDTVNSKLVSLGDNAFSSDKKLKNIMLPYNLVKIGDNAFSGCSALATITFDGYDKVTLEDGSTQDVLNTNCMSKLEELGVGAFLNCVSLTTISVPNGVTEVKDSTFNNCKSLVSIEFDIVNSKLKTIGEQAFAGCGKLGSVLDLTDPENIELVTVNLPNSLVKVGTEAFMNCSGMWGIQFNYNISEIGDNAFNGCSNLAKVDIYRATAPTIYAGTFVTNGNYRLRIYVNKSSLTNVNNSTISEIIYKYTTKWSTVWANAKNYIYERGTMPTVNYTHPDSEQVVTAQADVILTPKANFGNGNVFSFAYDVLEQSSTMGGDKINRNNAKVVEYGSQKYTDSVTNETYTLLIVDYDIVTLKYVAENQ